MTGTPPAGPTTAPRVRGRRLDRETRCAHYHGPTDIIAIKFKCCGEYYACASCHDELAGHAAARWPPHEWDEPAVRCGACGRELSVREYFDAQSICPRCRAPFNPRCQLHWPLYFDFDGVRS